MFKKNDKIWGKFSDTTWKIYDSEPVYNGKYLKSKTKFHESKIDTYFWDNGMPKNHFYCICLSAEFVDSFF